MKKYILAITLSIMAVFILIALPPLQASVSKGESVKLPAKATAAIDVEIPKAFGEKVSSLQLSLEITNEDGTQADAEVLKGIETLSFTPNEAVSSKAKICEERYHKDTGILDIYIAGTEPVFPENGALAVGTVKAVFQDDKNTDIYVKVTDDSLKVVKGIMLKTITDEPDAVRINVGEAPSVTEDPDKTQDPSGSDVPSQSENPDKTQDPGSTDVPSEPENPDKTQDPGNPDAPQNPSNPIVDTSKLNAALEVAATLKESDYTADSFALLKKAVEEGKALLNNPNATQEQLDQAADAIYNAIGMLVFTSKTSADISSNNNPIVKSSNQDAYAALTGDASQIVLYVAMFVVSMGVVTVVIARKKRQNSSR